MSRASTIAGYSAVYAAYNMRKQWEYEGFRSLWVFSNGNVRPSRQPKGHTDDFRVGYPDGQRVTASRIDLSDKRAVGAAIANAIRCGKIGTLSTAGDEPFEEGSDDVSIATVDVNVKPEPWRRKTDDELYELYGCRICGDITSFCECADLAPSKEVGQ